MSSKQHCKKCGKPRSDGAFKSNRHNYCIDCLNVTRWCKKCEEMVSGDLFKNNQSPTCTPCREKPRVCEGCNQMVNGLLFDRHDANNCISCKQQQKQCTICLAMKARAEFSLGRGGVCNTCGRQSRPCGRCNVTLPWDSFFNALQPNCRACNSLRECSHCHSWLLRTMFTSDSHVACISCSNQPRDCANCRRTVPGNHFWRFGWPNCMECSRGRDRNCVNCGVFCSATDFRHNDYQTCKTCVATGRAENKNCIDCGCDITGQPIYRVRCFDCREYNKYLANERAEFNANTPRECRICNTLKSGDSFAATSHSKCLECRFDKLIQKTEDILEHQHEPKRKCHMCKVNLPESLYRSTEHVTCRYCGECSMINAPFRRPCDAHGKQPSQCNECIDVSGRCAPHHRITSRCVPCGGNAVCECGIVKYECTAHGCESICEHGIRIRNCSECNAPAHLTGLIRAELRRMLKGGRMHCTAEQNYTQCTTMELLSHIQSQFKFNPGMTWGNYGDWEIDHKIALLCESPIPTIDVVLQRAVMENIQPLWKTENQKKGKY